MNATSFHVVTDERWQTEHQQHKIEAHNIHKPSGLPFLHKGVPVTMTESRKGDRPKGNRHRNPD
jgi:hypothetical protein